MSFDLSFWRYEGATDRDHVAVAAGLMAGEDVPGVGEIDAPAMIERLGEVLKGWRRDGTHFEAPTKAGGYLTCIPGPRILVLHMSHNVARAVMLKISTPMRRFGCGLWNPQTSQRIAGYEEGEAP